MPYRCEYQNCKKHPRYGEVGSKKRKFCAEHAAVGMVDVGKRKQCAAENCFVQPSYGAKGTTNAEFCSKHAKEGQVTIVFYAGMVGFDFRSLLFAEHHPP